MNFAKAIILLMPSMVSAMANSPDPLIVRAVVRSLEHDPNSAPIDWRNIPGKEPPVWNVKLEIQQVLQGDPKLKGQTLITSTADTEPQGNRYVVTPRLNVGDEGIWAIKRAAEGSWIAVYGGHKIEEGIFLPLIKGRHDVYEKVLTKLSDSAVISEPHIVVKAQQSTPKHSEQPISLARWILLVALSALGLGLLFLLSKRRS